ncbi:MAG: hypothetical protein IPG01_12920 [Chitinophagaceae bacterium]|nr:hypothetical protein [Chitinophagaceae bacterium]
MKISLIFFLTTFLLPLTGYTQPGTLDSTFGVNKHITTHIGSWENDRGSDAITQPDGKVIVAGVAYEYGSSAGAIVRYHADGSIDSSFGGDGKALYLGWESYFSSIALQSDGKLVAGGSEFNFASYERDFLVVRFNSDGTVDNSFGISGKMLISFSQNSDEDAVSVLIQADDKIVVVGNGASNTGDRAIVRLNTDGALDSTFSDDGKLTLDSTEGGYITYASAIQTDGKILVGEDDMIVRLLTDGTLDPSFGVDGKIMLDISTESDRITSMIIQPDGKIVAAGVSDYIFNAELQFFSRYTAEGILDTSFGSSGILIYDTINAGIINQSISSIDIQPDGRIVGVGYIEQESSFSGSGFDFVAIRVNIDGTIDSTFGNEGLFVYDFMGFDDKASAVVVEADGHIIVAGTGKVGEGGDFAWLRLKPDGSTSEFSPDGIVLLNVSENDDDVLNEILIQPDDKIIQIGYCVLNGPYVAVSRLLPDGTLDTSFGKAGRVAYKLGLATAGVLLPDGKILVAGNTSMSPKSAILAKMETNGDLDLSFGDAGSVQYDFDTFIDVTDMSLQSDGKIIVLTNVTVQLSSEIVLVRFNADGSIDNSFGLNGEAVVQFGGWEPVGNAIIIQPDGKILIAGSYYDEISYTDNFIVARLLEDGTHDNSFGFNGIATTDFDNGFHDHINAMVLQPDGKIICAGTTAYYNNGYDGIGLVRYNSDGALDSSFGMMGIVTTDFPSTIVIPNSMILLPDNKIIIGGSYKGSFMVGRYLVTGEVDQTFGSNGFTFSNVSPYPHGDAIHSLALQSDGKLIAGVQSLLPDNLDMTLARYLIEGLGTNAPQANVGATYIYIYPNPAHKRFIIEMKLREDLNTVASIRIVSPIGLRVLEDKVPVVNGLLRKEFEIENVATGVYGVIVTIGNEVWSEKVVIQR